MQDFIGVKIALIHKDEILITHRDDKPGLEFANMWELPGGAREPGETPFECIAREVYEELGLSLSPEQIVWQKVYPAMRDPNLTAYFMVAHITSDDIVSVKFGDEGQGWKMASIKNFMNDPKVIPALKVRLQDYFNSIS